MELPSQKRSRTYHLFLDSCAVSEATTRECGSNFFLASLEDNRMQISSLSTFEATYKTSLSGSLGI